MSTRPIVWLDLETTGLDPQSGAQAVEVAWAVDDSEIQTLVLPHSVVGATNEALAINRYWERKLADLSTWCAQWEEALVKDHLEGATLAGANPAFDAAFLKHRWGRQVWHHRLLDVEAYAAGFLGSAAPSGLADTARIMRDLGHDIPEPDHTAAGDVATARAIYKTCRAADRKDIP